jgi:hypothetical protein
LIYVLWARARSSTARKSECVKARCCRPAHADHQAEVLDDTFVLDVRRTG